MKLKGEEFKTIEKLHRRIEELLDQVSLKNNVMYI
jgi:hypothetical protein